MHVSHTLAIAGVSKDNKLILGKSLNPKDILFVVGRGSGILHEDVLVLTPVGLGYVDRLFLRPIEQ